MVVPDESLITQQELSKPVEFAEVQTAFNTFTHDYEIVGHPHTPVNTPFNPPNGPTQKDRDSIICPFFLQI